jgi:tetratricopeptide (TPR) repeat protein
LEVGVPDEIVQKVCGLNVTTQKRLQKDSYLKGLFRKEGEGRRIYHAILADYVSSQISEAEKKEYHSRAAGVYWARLAAAREEQIKPDALAAMRLAGHVLEAEGKEAFLYAFVNECYGPLTMLGLLDAAIGLSERAQKMVEKDSEEKAVMLCNLGNVYYTKGELDKAEEMHKKSLEIEKKLGRLVGMAAEYGNLGLIYMGRGELDKAEEMFRDGLKIDEKFGRLMGMASKYGNLGNIYMNRGELDKAEEMHKKSLEIEEKLGRLEGMASDYANLGSVYEERRDIKKAREYWEEALGLYKRIGMPHEVEKVEGWIRGIGK